MNAEEIVNSGEFEQFIREQNCADFNVFFLNMMKKYGPKLASEIMFEINYKINLKMKEIKKDEYSTIYSFDKDDLGVTDLYAIMLTIVSIATSSKEMGMKSFVLGNKKLILFSSYENFKSNKLDENVCVGFGENKTLNKSLLAIRFSYKGEEYQVNTLDNEIVFVQDNEKNRAISFGFLMSKTNMKSYREI